MCIGLFHRTIDRQSPHFLKALTATASIQLEHKRDPAAYVHCYSQLAEEHADYESYRLLGAALMRIQEPEKAIKVRPPTPLSLAPCCVTLSLPGLKKSRKEQGWDSNKTGKGHQGQTLLSVLLLTVLHCPCQA